MFLDAYKNSNAKLNATPKGLAAFDGARLCCTTHWGLYSLVGRGEWTMHHDRIDIETYEELASKFNPAGFNAAQWADALAEAGVKLLLITSKHHDGFCMYDSKLTEYKVTNTPFGRDPMKELAPALRSRGISLHFYYSLLDWHHPDYLYDWDGYVKYYHGQVRELCENYGPLGGILLDGYWPDYEPYKTDPACNHFHARGDYRFGELYDMIHTLQPDAVITNNTHIPPLAGEDYQIFELDCPGENVVGFNTTHIGDMPLASWFPMNNSWGYNRLDTQYKSVGTLAQRLLKLSGTGANLFLNFCPNENGALVPEERELLRGLGRFMRRNGEAIYGTRPVPNGKKDWGYVVTDGENDYIYLLSLPSKTAADRFTVDCLTGEPDSIVTMDGEELTFSCDGGAVAVMLPVRPKNPTGLILKCQIKRG